MIWFCLCPPEKKEIIDPLFEDRDDVFEALIDIYKLFENEFEDAPQNERLQDILEINADSDVASVRETLLFIARESFLWNHFYNQSIKTFIKPHLNKDGALVLTEQVNFQLYVIKVNFLFNVHSPLLGMRVVEYYAQILGEAHPQYQFINNISKQIIDYFLLKKIEKDGFLLEHIDSQKQIFLSNEFTDFEHLKLIENETILNICLVKWKDNIWQNMGYCAVAGKDDVRNMKHIPFPMFADQQEEQKLLSNILEEAFLDITNGNRLIYLQNIDKLSEFQTKLSQKIIEIVDKLKDASINVETKDMANLCETASVLESKHFCLYLNKHHAIEVGSTTLMVCMDDKNNPFYNHNLLRLDDFVTHIPISADFFQYLLDRQILQLTIPSDAYLNQNMENIILENWRFLFRYFHYESHYEA